MNNANIPAGYRLVPIEPTDEMVAAGAKERFKGEAIAGVYAAMLAAAPVPPQAEKRCSCPSGDGSLAWPCQRHPPQADAQPVMRLVAEKLLGLDGEYAVDFVKPGWLEECRKTGGTLMLYTHPDADEAHDLLAATSLEAGKRIDALEKERDTLRAQLDKAAELLRGCHTGDLFGPEGYELVEEFLSTTAKPEVCKNCNGTRRIKEPGCDEGDCSNCAKPEFDSHRLLSAGDIITATDEHLGDDAATWAPVGPGIFNGMKYIPGRMLPVRRIIAAEVPNP